MTDNKEFWKTVKPFLSNSPTTFPIEKGEVISDESKVVNSFSNFFENAMRSRTFSGELGFKKKPLEIAHKKLSSTQIEILLTKIH